MKKRIENVISLTKDEDVKNINKKTGQKFDTTQEQMEKLIDNLLDSFIEVAKDGYVDDSIKITIDIEYIPEDK